MTWLIIPGSLIVVALLVLGAQLIEAALTGEDDS